MSEQQPAADHPEPVRFEVGDIVRSTEGGRRGRWYVDDTREYMDGGCMILIDDVWLEADSYEKVTYGRPLVSPETCRR